MALAKERGAKERLERLRPRDFITQIGNEKCEDVYFWRELVVRNDLGTRPSLLVH